MAVDHYYHRNAVDRILKDYKNRVTRLTTENNKLSAALYDRRTMIEDFASVIADSINEYAQEAEPVKYVKRRSRQPWDGHLPIADPHLGKYVWGKEGWGDDYDTPIACERIRHCGDEARDWMLSQSGACRFARASNIGDFWHAIEGRTESGTLLHQDSRAKKVIDMGVKAELYRLDQIRSACEHLHVDFTEGNHDYDWLHMTYLAIQMYFKDVPDVTVHVRPTEKVWFRVGNVVHFLDHGKGLNKLSSESTQLRGWNAINMVMSPSDQNDVEHYYYYIGHLHHREVSETIKMELMRLPAIAEPDDYEEEHRVGSRVGAMCYRLDPDGYISDTHSIRFKG